MMDASEVLRLRRVVNKIARELNASAAHEGLTPSEASALGLVVTHRRLAISELIALEGLNPTMLSRVVRKLVEAGLVSRVPDPQDQRTAHLEPTPAGKALHERIQQERISIVTECVSSLDDADAEQLSKALPALEALRSALTERRMRPADSWAAAAVGGGGERESNPPGRDARPRQF